MTGRNVVGEILTKIKAEITQEFNDIELQQSDDDWSSQSSLGNEGNVEELATETGVHQMRPAETQTADSSEAK